MNADPFSIFQDWMTEAVEAGHLQPEAMALSTATREGKVSSRMVLFKGFSQGGLRFVTNFNSRKAKDLAENPYASLLFFWEKIAKQIRIEGKIERLSDSETDEYWKTRPRESQIGAWASKQSSNLSSREELESAVRELTQRFAGKEIPRPAFWGGYRLIPNRFEFWCSKPGRLHDRELFTREGDQNTWHHSLLYP